MKKVLIAILAVCTAATVSLGALAGCGSSNTTTTTVSSEAAAGTSSTEAVSSETSSAAPAATTEETTAALTAGEWELEYMVYDGQKMSLEDYMNNSTVRKAVEDSIAATGSSYTSDEIDSAVETTLELVTETTYTFKDDGTCVGEVAGTEVSGTYTVDGNTVTMTVAGTTSTMTYDAATGELSTTATANGITSTSVMVCDVEEDD